METLKQGWKNPIDYLNYCLTLKKEFEKGPEVISLTAKSMKGNGDAVGCRDMAVSTAYQCYAPGVTAMRGRDDEKSLSVATSTLDSGHHTTRQHGQYTFKIMMSRAAAHDFFNDFPYYNTSQQSQRYVEIEKDHFLIPAGLNEGQRDNFIKTANRANERYFQMIDKLAPVVKKALKDDDFPLKTRDDKAKKAAQEIARYVLPVNQFTLLDYSISELTLLRMFRVSQQRHVSDESRYIVGRMVEELSKVDKQILEELRVPLVIRDEEIEYDEKLIKGFKKEFDDNLGGHVSKLEYFDNQSRELVARSVRSVLGVSKQEMSDKKALEKLLNPKDNLLLGDVYESGQLDPLTKCLRLANFQFAVKLSHSGDSQRQRHRTIAGATPPMEAIYDGSPDYYVPMIVRGKGELSDFYSECQEELIEGINRSMDLGVDKKTALYLLSNAQNIRLYERGDGLDLLHRFKLRLCKNAQEEIWNMAVDQARQVVEVFPEMDQILRPPCDLRKQTGVMPPCPEGTRFCGQRVWDMNVTDTDFIRRI